jgi:hypothetical protein
VESSYSRFRRKAKWILIAIFAPEVVLYSAWQQYYMARRFCHDMYKIKLEQAGLPVLPVETHWQWLADLIARLILGSRRKAKSCEPKISTMETHAPTPTPDPVTATPTKPSLTYGFYVCMGGLVVDVADIYDNLSRATLTRAGVLHFAQKSQWERFYVADETIRDKSKADKLAKVLVFFQVSWTLLQCISRAAQGYPLTVLEVHTLVHAACAMLMYAFWFRKPLNVGDPSLVDCDPVEDVALELMRSAGSAYEPFTTLRHENRFWSAYSWDARHRQDDRAASEAAFVLFNTEVLQADSENLSCRSVLPILEKLDAQEKAAPPAQTAFMPRSGESTSDDENRHSRFSEGDFATLEAQSTTGSDGLQATLHRTQFDNVDEAKFLATGHTLGTGIGPTALMMLPLPPRIRFTMRSLVPEIKKVAPVPMRIHEIDSSLRSILPLREDEDHEDEERLICNKMAISLSQKDLLRWNRAGLAYAWEIRATQDPDHTLPRNAVNSSTGQAADIVEDGGLRHSQTTLRGRTVNARWTSSILQDIFARKPKGGGFMCAPNSFVLRATNEAPEIMPKPWNLDKETLLDARTGISFLAISGAYAAVHLGLWNYEFPTEVESLLWKIASCALGAPFGVLCALMAIALLVDALLVCLDYLTTDPSHSTTVDGGKSAPTLQTVENEVRTVTAQCETLDTAPHDAHPIDVAREPIPEERGLCRAFQSPENVEQPLGTQSALFESRHGVDNTAQMTIRTSYPPRSAPGPALGNTLDRASAVSDDAPARPDRVLDVISVVMKMVGLSTSIVVVAAGIFLYLLSRFYIVVEAFVSLRRVPVGAYDRVTWAQYIPHL